MRINENNIKNITVQQFKTLLDSIGVMGLRNNLLELSKTFPKTSIYYTGKKGNGAFWDGFRKETFPKNRIYSFYVDEVYHNKSKLDLYYAFESILLEKYGFGNEEFNLDEIKEIEVRIILSKILDVAVDPNDLNESIKKQLDEKYQIEINNLRAEYEEKIKKLVEKKEHEKQEEVHAVMNKYNATIQELKNNIIEVEDKNEKLTKYEIKFKKICEEIKIQDDIERFVIEKQISSFEEIKMVLKDGFVEIIDKIDSDEDLSKLIVRQYIIYKLMKK